MTHVAGRRFLDVHTGSSADGGGEGGAGLRIEETTDMGEKYVVDVTTGEKFIRGSRRPDGTYRKDIRVRSDYVPLDERRAFQTRQQLSRSQRGPLPGGVIGGGGLAAASSFPPGYSGPPAPLPSRKSKARSGAAAAAAPVAAAAAGGGSDAGGKRNRGKKTGAGSKEGAAGAVSPRLWQQQKKEEQKQSPGEGDAADTPVAKDVESQLADEVEGKLRLDGDVAGAGCNSSSTSGSSKVTGGDETRHGNDARVAYGTEETPKTPEELRKRVRLVKKRLNEIEVLRAKVEAGASITEVQKQKLQRAEPLKKELETLEKQLQMNEEK